jgi:hypothetical protein
MFVSTSYEQTFNNSTVNTAGQEKIGKHLASATINLFFMSMFSFLALISDETFL